MAILFDTKTPTGVSNAGGLSKFLAPKPGKKGVNVVDEYTWTLTPKKGRAETPIVELTEYRLLDAALKNASRYYAFGLTQQTATGPFSNLSWFRQGSNSLAWLTNLIYGSNSSVAPTNNPYVKSGSPYAGLFDFNNATGFKYVFPYFGEINNEVQSTWTSLDIFDKVQNAVGSFSSQAREALETVTKVAGTVYETNYPRVGIMDRPKLWEQSAFRTINIRFPLFNTQSVDDILKNWELCYLLMYQNMFNKRDFVTAVPPVFYTVYVPGQYFTIAAYVSNLQIRNRGNMRLIQVDGKERNVPDVYEIDMTLTDMVMPSQNMQSVLLDEAPINVQQLNQAVPGTSYNTGTGTSYPYTKFPQGGDPIQFTPFGSGQTAWRDVINSSPRGGISFAPNNRPRD